MAITALFQVEPNDSITMRYLSLFCILATICLAGCGNDCDCLGYATHKAAFQNSKSNLQGFANLTLKSAHPELDGVLVKKSEMRGEAKILSEKAAVYEVQVFSDSSLIFFPEVETSFWGWDEEFIIHVTNPNRTSKLLSVINWYDRMCIMEDGWICVKRRASLAS